jgi:hypothetical protein
MAKILLQEIKEKFKKKLEINIQNEVLKNSEEIKKHFGTMNQLFVHLFLKSFGSLNVEEIFKYSTNTEKVIGKKFII